VRRSDRLARLHELLARVQRNTAERRGEIAAASLAQAEPVELPSEPPAPVERRAREPIPPPPSRPREADDWSSLLSDDVSDASLFAEPSEETSFPSLVPPDPLPISDANALVTQSAPVAARVHEEEPDDPAPESQFEHAMRIAAEQRPQPPDPRALWLDAADELRERRITLPPEEEPEAESEPPPITTPPPPITTPPPASTTPIPHSRRSARPPPMSRRRRAAPRPSPAPIVMGELPVEKPTPYWAVVLLGCGVGLLFTLAYVAFRALDVPRGAVAQAVPNTTLATTAAMSTTTASPPATQLPSPAPHVEPASAAPASAAPALELPLPAIERPKDMGLLWVDAPSPVTVYVQGLPVGANGRYLEVPCGLKNVRLARSDPPPPGHSFPMWLGKAESVLVPCGGANRVKMSSE
jgi:hypothetical protein